MQKPQDEEEICGTLLPGHNMTTVLMNRAAVDTCTRPTQDRAFQHSIMDGKNIYKNYNVTIMIIALKKKKKAHLPKAWQCLRRKLEASQRAGKRLVLGSAKAPMPPVPRRLEAQNSREGSPQGLRLPSEISGKAGINHSVEAKATHRAGEQSRAPGLGRGNWLSPPLCSTLEWQSRR